MHALKLSAKPSRKIFVLDALHCEGFLKLRSAASSDSLQLFWYYFEEILPFFSSKCKGSKKINSF